MSVETLSQQAYRRLKEDIVEGRIPAESVLSERALADELGISRTPLRSAISQLESDGVVDRLPNGVILVRSVTVEQLMEIVKMRQHLESAAAARAAAYPMPGDLAALRDEMQALAEGEETVFDRFWEKDERFHMAVARAARLAMLPDILVDQRAIARRCSLTRTYDSFRDQAREHVEVADAIAAGDATRAHAAMWLHFDNVRHRFLQTFGR